MRRKWTNWNKYVVLCHRLRLRFYVCMYITFNLNGLMVSFRWNENRSLCLCLVHTWAFSQTPCQPSGIRDGIQPYAWMNWIKPNEWPCLGEEKLGKTAVLVIRKIRNYIAANHATSCLIGSNGTVCACEFEKWGFFFTSGFGRIGWWAKIQMLKFRKAVWAPQMGKLIINRFKCVMRCTSTSGIKSDWNGSRCELEIVD